MTLRASFIFLAALTASNPSFAADEEQPAITAADFLAEYRPALAKLESRYANFTCQAVHRRQTYSATVDYSVAGPSFLSVQTYDLKAENRPPDYPRVHLRSETPNCFFELSTDVPGKDFFISQIGDDNAEVLRRYHRRYNKPIALAAFHVFDVSMRTLIETESVNIKEVVRDTDQGTEVVSVQFQIDGEVSKFRKALVRLQPSQDYRIVSYELFFSADHLNRAPDVVYSGQVQYQSDEHSQFEVPMHVLIQCDNGTGTVSLVEDADVEQFRFDVVSEQQFQLPNFGIPDISTAQSTSAERQVLTTIEVDSELTLGGEVDLLIPVPVAESDYCIVGVESVKTCGKLGCGQVQNLPQKILVTTRSNVLYRFKSRSAGEDVIKVVVITDHPTQPRIPILLSIRVADDQDN